MNLEETTQRYTKLAQDLAKLREEIPDKVCCQQEEALNKKFEQTMEVPAVPRQFEVKDYVTTCVSDTERIKLFQKVDDVIKKFHNVKSVLEYKKNLALNETQAVLFGKSNDSTYTVPDDNSSMEVTVESSTYDTTINKDDEEDIADKSYGTKKTPTTKNTSSRKARASSSSNKTKMEEKSPASKKAKKGSNKEDDSEERVRVTRKAFHHSMLPEGNDKGGVGTPIRPRRTPRRRSTAN